MDRADGQFAMFLNDKDGGERTHANRGTRVKRLQALPSSTAHRFRRVWLAVDFAEPCSLSPGREVYQCACGNADGRISVLGEMRI